MDTTINPVITTAIAETITANLVITTAIAETITATFTTLAATTTATFTAIVIASEGIAVFTTLAATTIAIFTATGAIGGIGTSTTTIGPMVEAIITTVLQGSFTLTRRGGIGLAIAKREIGSADDLLIEVKLWVLSRL